MDNDRAIICGDWNLIIDPDLDCENYKHIDNPKARGVVKEFLEDLDYMDAYRFGSPKSTRRISKTPREKIVQISME